MTFIPSNEAAEQSGIPQNQIAQWALKRKIKAEKQTVDGRLTWVVDYDSLMKYHESITPPAAYISTPEAATIAGVTRSTVGQWCQHGHVKAIKSGIGGAWYLCPDDLQRFLVERKDNKRDAEAWATTGEGYIHSPLLETTREPVAPQKDICPAFKRNQAQAETIRETLQRIEQERYR